MPGEVWRETYQIGKETTSGTAVGATRVLYVDGANSNLSRTRAAKPHMFATTTRDNVRAYTAGPVQAAGTMRLPVSSDELVEFMLLGLKGGTTPTTPGGATLGRLWTFTPSTTLDSATIQWNDGANLWQMAGTRVDTIDISGSVSGDNLATFGLFGTNLATLGALTGSLTQRTPTFFEGWESRLYIDPFGATPGTTVVPGTMINWSVKYGNALGRKYTADNTLSANSIPFGAMTCTAQITFEAAAPQTLTEFAAWENGTATPTKRMVRLQFGNNAVIELTGTSSVGTTTAITESGFTATYTVANTLVAGNYVVVTGATPAGYNGTFQVVSAAAGSFTVQLPVSGLGAASVQGVVNKGTPLATQTNIDLPGSWTAFDLSRNDASTTVYLMTYQYVYDPTNAFGIQVSLQNARTTAY